MPKKTPVGGPSWRAVAEDLRAKIASGQLPLGEAIPSTPKLMETYDVSSTVVRRAVSTLTSEGLLLGHGGKGVYVTARPADLEREQASIEAMQEQIAALRTAADRIETNLKHLYDRLGHTYPQAETPATPADRRRTGTGG